MKSSNIADSVFKVNLKYVKLQNETKELFFRCLNENRDISYFNDKIREIWGDLDYSFMLDEITDYEALIHERNVEGKEITEVSKQGDIFDLVPLAVIIGVEQKFVKQKEKEYKSSQKYVNKLEKDIENATSETYKEIKEEQKQEYLKLKVKRYNNQIVPYYSKETGEIIRYVQPSTYNSMIHNTNLTRSGWNTTLNDADMLGENYFIIKYHPFSCEHCIDHQNKIMSKNEVINLVGFAEEVEGDILHPNCKCLLKIYEENDLKDIETPFKYNFTREEKIEFSKIRQKVNTLTLKKEEVITDMKIQKMLGNQDEVDKLNQQRNKINKEIRNLASELPTQALKKQVIAINR